MHVTLDCSQIPQMQTTTKVFNKMKIICIGFNKTGTLSLNKAFLSLGFNSKHRHFENKPIPDIMLANKSAGRKLLDGMEFADCVMDFYPQYFKELHEQYPDCKFILTTRNKNDWLRSRTAHVKRNQRDQNYEGGWLKVEKRTWSREWNQYHSEVLNHFKDSSNFLVLDICAGEGFEKLCPFLSLPVPDAPFPELNATPHRSLFTQFRTWLGRFF